MEKELRPNVFNFTSTKPTKLSEAVAFFDEFLSDSNKTLKNYLKDQSNRERVNASWVFIFYMTLSHGTQEEIRKVKDINNRIPKLAENFGYVAVEYGGAVNEKMPPKEAIETLKCEFSQKAGITPTQFLFLEKVETLINSGLIEELEVKQQLKNVLRKRKKKAVKSDESKDIVNLLEDKKEKT